MAVATYANFGAITTVPGSADTYDLGSVDREWRRLYLGAQTDALQFGIGQDAILGRLAADVLGLAGGDSFRIPTDGQLQFGTDVVLTRGAADRLDLAAGDRLRLQNASSVGVLLRVVDNNTLDLRNDADTAFVTLQIDTLYVFSTNAIATQVNAAEIRANNVDANVLELVARDTGVGLVNVARLVGAADPYFEATLPMVLNPSAVPGTLVTGHIWYDSTGNNLQYRDSAPATRIVANLEAAQTFSGAKTFSATITSSVVGDAIIPSADNQGNVGSATRRFALVRAVTVTSGDLCFENGWKLTEAERLGLGEGIAVVRPDGSVATVLR